LSVVLTRATMDTMSTDAALKALAEPHRRAILRLVRDDARSVTEIAEHFDITQQAVSLHLKVLREAGLVAVRRDGTRRLYLIDPDGMSSVQEFLAELWPAGLDRLKRAVEYEWSGRQLAAHGPPADEIGPGVSGPVSTPSADLSAEGQS
jgi:DNA-binding transcriptional ArsR family regulator